MLIYSQLICFQLSHALMSKHASSQSTHCGTQKLLPHLVMGKKIVTLGSQEPQPAGTKKCTTALRLGKIKGTTSVVRSIQDPHNVVRYKNFHVDDGGKTYIFYSFII